MANKPYTILWYWALCLIAVNWGMKGREGWYLVNGDIEACYNNYPITLVWYR